MKRFLFALCVMAASARAAAGPPHSEVIATRFIDVLRHDDLARLAKLVDPAEDDTRAWEELRTVVDRYDCLRVARYEWSVTSSSDDRIALLLDVDLTGALKAAWRPERRLPSRWYVEARRSGGAWRVSRVITEERRVAQLMAAAPTAHDAECLFDEARGIDRLVLISRYAREVSESRPVDFARLQHALTLAEEAHDLETELTVRNDYSVALSEVDPPRMLPFAKEGEARARAGTPDNVADSLFTLGLAYALNGERDLARETYSAAAEMIDVVDEPIGSVMSLQMRAWLGYERGSPIEQLRFAEKLLERARRIGWEEGEQLALFNHQEVHWQLGNLDEVRADCFRLIALGREQGNRKFVAYALVNLAKVEMREEHYAAAVLHYREAVELFSDTALTNTTLLDLSHAYIQRREFSEAEKVLARVEQLLPPDASQRVAILARRSELHLAQGHAGQAVAAAREALKRFDVLTERTYTEQATVLHDLARALAASGREDEAVIELRGAIAAIENREEELGADPLGRVAFHQEYVEMYVELIELLAARNQITEALHVAEEMKGRGLREAIAESHIDLSESLSPEERTREEGLRTRIAEINRTLLAARQKQQPMAAIEEQLAGARRDLDAFRAEIRLKHPVAMRRRSASILADELPPGSEGVALIEYVVARKQLLAFIVAPHAPVRVVRMPAGSARLQRDVRELESLIAARSPAYRGAARRLYDLLVAPVEKHLGKAATLAIAPDGVLWTVPFQALVARDGRHLVDHHALFYAHSLSLLHNASAPRSSAPSFLLALGNPAVGGGARTTLHSVFRDAALGPLDDAESEVQALASMYPSRGRSVYYRDRATEAAFKSEAPKFRVIHIAAHAIVDDRAPMYSAIALAPGSGNVEDGLLEAREVVDLPLNADLAVLSACQTARGKVGSGEGVIGLSWAFFAAGCPTTVVSQWSAESAATAKLMVEFHRRLRAGESTANALRGAQRSVRGIAKYRHPFYWAPFVAIGAGQR